MEYSVQQLSRLSGVTARTLRWYDEIGLLKPCRVGENGYRFYGRSEVDRLQMILHYRALGVELAQIKEYLDDPSFDRLTAFRRHLSVLEKEKERLHCLIHAVEQAIRWEERNEIMMDEQKFQAFKRNLVEENERAYGAEARKKYGDAQVDEANAAVMGLSREEYQEWTALGEEIQTMLEKGVREQEEPEGELGKELTRLHRRWITLSGVKYDPQRHKGIAELYVMDERFGAYYDREVSGCARFLRDAVHHWAE